MLNNIKSECFVSQNFESPKWNKSETKLLVDLIPR
jgi:hypothetical protein